MKFRVANRVITYEKENLIGDNEDYVAHFDFDSEWNGTIKTARFQNQATNNYVDVILENDKCVIPRDILKYGIMLVGVFANGMVTTSAKVFITDSIKEKSGNTVAPSIDIYEQIIALIEKISQGGATEEQIINAVEKYFEENPIDTVSEEDVKTIVSNYLEEHKAEFGYDDTEIKEELTELKKTVEDIPTVEPYDDTEIKESVSQLSREITDINDSISGFVKKAVTDFTYSNTVTDIVRTYVPCELEKDKEYTVKLTLNEFTRNPTSKAGMNIRTTLDKSTNTIIDGISGELNPNVGEYKWSFVASQSSNYLYVYFNSAKNANLDYKLEVYTTGLDIDNLKSELKGDKGNNEYVGQRINLLKYTYDINQFQTTKKPSGYDSFQGMAIHNDKMFRLFHNGQCAVYDLSTKNKVDIAHFDLGSYGVNVNHANNCGFSNKYYESTDIYPLLYVTDGNSVDVMQCAVERISNDLSGSAKVQTITLDQSGFTEKGLETYWGWSAWLIADDYLYYFGAKYRTNGSQRDNDSKNKYIVTKFDIPSITESEVTLTASDVKEQWTTPYDVEVTQGGGIYKDYIFYCFGYGNSNFPSIIKVLSLSQKSSIAKINLRGTTLEYYELEDCDVYNGKLIVGCNGENVFEIDFK